MGGPGPTSVIPLGVPNAAAVPSGAPVFSAGTSGPGGTAGTGGSGGPGGFGGVFPGGGGGGPGGGGGGIAIVPEPATWAMMILGFGLIGFSMRSKRSRPRLDQRLQSCAVAEDPQGPPALRIHL
ncbi:MAG: PEPxxWA-CTERM sorting domain-containing protein [Sphingopyxis sp.]|nr:PEPxxWA-CTERM sorting domain-containing protein [Sphingopyxis sp.]